MKAAEIRFVCGRLKFGNCDNSAPFPSAIVIFRPCDGKMKVNSYESVFRKLNGNL